MNVISRESAAERDDAPIGILAGWGRYPLAVAESLKAQGRRVAVVGVRDHADPALEKLADHMTWIRLGGIGKAIRAFRAWGVRRAVMAGKIHKVTIYQPLWWVRHRPDWTGLRTFYRHFVSGREDRRDDTLLGALTDAFSAAGIQFEPATNFVPDLLATPGIIAGKPLSARQQRDVQFGWGLARQMGGLDIGQTVCVKDQAVLSIEAIEGTDACIRRAGQLCRQGGFTVVKVAKPQQDMRFDVPTIGVGTLESISAAGGSVLAVEAGRTILLDGSHFRQIAQHHRLTVFAAEEPAICRTAA